MDELCSHYREDTVMDRNFGAPEALDFIRSVDFPGSDVVFDAAFASKK